MTTDEPISESQDCRDCKSFATADKCIDCSGSIPDHRAGDLFEPKDVTDAQRESEANWDTYHDRAAEPPDPMLEEGQGEPNTTAIVPVEPWWTGGPLDTVTPKGEHIGLPWNMAVLKVPEGRHIVLLPGEYNNGGAKAMLTVDLRIDCPVEPDEIIQAMLMAAEADARVQAEEQSRVSYQGGETGQSTISGEPMVRGSIEEIDVKQLRAVVDKFILRTTREGLDNALGEEKMSLEQWVYHKMRPLTMDTYISGSDWAEGCRQLVAVLKGAA